MSPTSLYIGNPIITYTMYIKRATPQGFVLEWYTDPESTIPATQLDGEIIRITIGDAPVVIYDTVCVGNVATFSLTAEQTNLPFQLYDGVIYLVGTDDVPLVDLRVEVGPN